LPQEVLLRAYLLAALLLLVIFGGIAGYLYQRMAGFSSADFTPPPATVAADTARPETRVSSLQAVGTIRAVRGVELSTEESGEITDIAVGSGDRVVAGQLLLTLNDKVERASRERQIANLELARLLFERDAQLVKQKSIPQTQYDRSKADLDSAIAQLAETEARLENKRLHAPFAGTVGIIHVRVGDYVEPGTTITTLQDLEELEVDFTVPDRYFPLLRRGQEIRVRVSAFPDREFPATLQAIDARADAGTRNLLLRASLAESSGLLPGMFARLTLLLDEKREVVTVPETAIAYSIQGNTVYVISEGDDGLVVQPRVVETGAVEGGRIAVTSGLEAGDRVVTAGQNKLYRGARITVDETLAL
jgi:membrane fusion protein (multidrug efflux system)